MLRAGQEFRLEGSGVTLFVFDCPRCKPYPVERDTFESFITPALKGRLEEREKTDNGTTKAAVLQFKDKCPRCVPNLVYEVILQFGS